MSEISTESSTDRSLAPEPKPARLSENNTRPLMFALIGASLVLLLGWMAFLGWAVVWLIHA
ncbi:hypothetical protein GCM10007036_08520 [Alsobacter metallidurans]|uniref:Uncharacterized protein n=1 Tax=Alsobacter metallidurans TaxID=340221 RepID=A0A917I557_9HYPH|nr:hypothetical protein [Alsobacter metallidurans]GGH11457.1 hypothetical protein GCM10007036_08520 [Alsobacter metallidurans]